MESREGRIPDRPPPDGQPVGRGGAEAGGEEPEDEVLPNAWSDLRVATAERAEQVLQALVRAARRSPGTVRRLMPESRAADLLETLARSRTLVVDLDSPPPPSPRSRRRVLLDETPTASEPRLPSPESWKALAQRLDARERVALEVTPPGAPRRLLLMGLGLRHAPEQRHWTRAGLRVMEEVLGLVPPERGQLQLAGPGTCGPAALDTARFLQDAPRTVRRSALRRRTPGTGLPPERPAQQRSTQVSSVRGRTRRRPARRSRRRPPAPEVRLGGLLFFIRPLRRMQLVRDHQDARLRERLLAFSQAVLRRVLAPLPKEARGQAFEGERPLVEVFCGVEVLPPDLQELRCDESACADAEQALDRLQDGLPRDLRYTVRGQRVFSGALARVQREPTEHLLAALVLRPGRLELSATHADVHLAKDSVDPALRAGGWDIDPGWVPHLGRIIRFHYDD